MLTRVETHPGGVAVLAPRSLADRAGIRSDRPADLEVRDGQLVVRAAPETLQELLAKITLDNVHSEWASGPPTGAELL